MSGKISKDQAEKAVLTLLQYITSEHDEEVLKNTPARVIKSFDELFAGYSINADKIIGQGFENNAGYNDKIIIDDIHFNSTCEHHMLPVRGFARISYIPNTKIMGLSKACRIVEAFARRLQLQERMTVQIAHTIKNSLQCKEVHVYIEATHDCMSIRGAMKEGATTKTSYSC